MIIIIIILVVVVIVVIVAIILIIIWLVAVNVHSSCARLGVNSGGGMGVNRRW